MIYQENDLVELKQELTNDVKKEIVAYLNSNGGTIYIGVKDNGEINPITDNAIRDKIDTTISSWIQEAFHPRPSNLINHYFNKHNVMVIEIKKGNEKPYFLREKGPKPSGVYKRVGRSCRQANEDEILSMLMDSKDYYYEKEVSEEQDLTFKYFFSVCDENGIKHETRNLKSLNIINSDNLYTNLGLLLSDQSPIVVKLARYDKHMNFIIKKEFKGSLIKILDNVIDQANINNDISAIIDTVSFKRKETISYPDSSLREGILNAFSHANFLIRSNIKIEFFPEKLRITNPGGIYKASLNDIMNGIQTYRNPGLVNVLNKLKYIENFGTGIPRIIEAYDTLDSKPEFNPSENFFILTLPNNNFNESSNDAVNDAVNDSVSDSVNNQIIKSLNQTDLDILKIIKNNPGINSNLILVLLKKESPNITIHVIKNSLRRKINTLCEFKGSYKNGGYYLIQQKNTFNQE